MIDIRVVSQESVVWGLKGMMGMRTLGKGIARTWISTRR